MIGQTSLTVGIARGRPDLAAGGADCSEAVRSPPLEVAAQPDIRTSHTAVATTAYLLREHSTDLPYRPRETAR